MQNKSDHLGDSHGRGGISPERMAELDKLILDSENRVYDITAFAQQNGLTEKVLAQGAILGYGSAEATTYDLQLWANLKEGETVSTVDNVSFQISREGAVLGSVYLYFDQCRLGFEALEPHLVQAVRDFIVHTSPDEVFFWRDRASPDTEGI